MHILSSTDCNYIMPTGVMIKSVSVNNSDSEIVFHIMIDDSVNPAQKKQLYNVVRDNKKHIVVFHNVGNETFEAFPSIGIVKDYISKAAYYRLMVADILDESLEKVLYLDVDIVVNKSLSELWEVDVDGYAVGAVADMAEWKQDYVRLGYPAEQGYFNSGVLLINLKYWREHKVEKRFAELMTNYPERIVQHDQDVLNIIFSDKKVSLPLKYNFQNGFLFRSDKLGIDIRKYKEEFADAKKNYVIIHYTTAYKPWFKDSMHPLKNIWFKYLSLTEWADYKPKRKVPVSMVGNALRFLRLLPPLPLEYNPYATLED